MSLRRLILNAYLRRFEKPKLAQVQDPLAIRQAFETQARLLFRMPPGVTREWQQIEADHRRLDALNLRPTNGAKAGLLFYIHGGAFILGSPDTHAGMVARLSADLGVPAVLPRYRLAPEAPFPAAIEDITAAWQGLLATGIDPARIVIGGDSAGGTLALSLLAQLCAENLPRPGGVFCLSPLTDLTFSGDSFKANRAREPLLPPDRAEDMTRMYLQDHAPDDPRVSPLMARFEGAPPVWITAAKTEILRDDARRMAARLERFGTDVTYREEGDLPHVWPIMSDMLPEGRQTLAEIADWIRQLPGWQGGS